jgi:hypothetical protein
MFCSDDRHTTSLPALRKDPEDSRVHEEMSNMYKYKLQVQGISSDVFTLMPIFFSGGPWVTPPNALSTMKAVT